MALRALLLALLLALPAWATEGFLSREGRFRVAMPVPPIQESTTHGTPVGDVTFHAWVARSGALACSVTYADLPALGIAMKAGREGVFDEATRVLLERTKGRLLEKGPAAAGSLRGREVTYAAGTSSGRARFFLDGRRLYIVDSLLSSGAAPQSAADFLASFEVVR